MFIFVPSFWCHCQLMSHEETFSTDLNFNAISQVHGDQVVALRCTVGTLKDFHISLGVGEIQVTRLCGRQSTTSYSVFLDNRQPTSASNCLISDVNAACHCSPRTDQRKVTMFLKSRVQHVNSTTLLIFLSSRWC